MVCPDQDLKNFLGGVLWTDSPTNSAILVNCSPARYPPKRNPGRTTKYWSVESNGVSVLKCWIKWCIRIEVLNQVVKNGSATPAFRAGCQGCTSDGWTLSAQASSRGSSAWAEDCHMSCFMSEDWQLRSRNSANAFMHHRSFGSIVSNLRSWFLGFNLERCVAFFNLETIQSHQGKLQKASSQSLTYGRHMI